MKSAGRVPWLAFKIAASPANRKLIISIPKRVVPLSVRRSRLKRLIREAVRRVDDIPPQGAAFHFIVRSAAPQDVDLSGVYPLVRDLIRGKHA